VRVGVEAAVDEDLVAVHLHQPIDQPRRVDRHELCDGGNGATQRRVGGRMRKQQNGQQRAQTRG